MSENTDIYAVHSNRILLPQISLNVKTYIKNTHDDHWTNICTSVFTAALFTTAKR